MKTIALTGGGTAGHVMPNIALLDDLKEHFSSIIYIGTNKIEKQIAKNNKLDFYEIKAPKLERKLTLKNLFIFYYLNKAVKSCKKILKEQKVDVVFSKGGYVALPVCIAAKKLKIPIVSHESDLTMGLANKLISKYANVICTSFKQTANYSKKCVYTGTPLRAEIFNGKILTPSNFDSSKKTVLFFGGSLGAKTINSFVTQNIDSLTKNYNVLHITGKQAKPLCHKNYFGVQFTDRIEDFYKTSNYVVCRSGANSCFEVLAQNKSTIFVPLSKQVSRGDQIQNAEYFKKQNLCLVINDEDLSLKEFNLQMSKIQKLEKSNIQSGNQNIIKQILKFV